MKWKSSYFKSYLFFMAFIALALSVLLTPIPAAGD